MEPVWTKQIVSNLVFASLLRQQDVRATEIDKVDMHLSFRAGDIVRAMVVSFMILYVSNFLSISILV